MATFRTTDVSIEDDIRTLITFTFESHGRIGCLFNNARGPGQTGGIEGLDVELFDATFANNVRSVMRRSRVRADAEGVWRRRMAIGVDRPAFGIASAQNRVRFFGVSSILPFACNANAVADLRAACCYGRRTYRRR